MKSIAGFVVAIAAVFVAGDAQGEAGGKIYDVVVYGGTSAGVAAAVQVKRLGKTVVLIEPTQRLGGLTTGGLGQTDIGNKAAIGGIAREFYERVRKHYDRAGGMEVAEGIAVCRRRRTVPHWQGRDSNVDLRT